MYIPSIIKVEKNNGQPFAVMTFTNGGEVVTDRLSFSDVEELNLKIKSKVELLNKMHDESLKVKVGEYIVIEPPAPEPKTPLEVATKELYRLKEQISLGVLKETDQEYIDAVAAYKASRNVKSK